MSTIQNLFNYRKCNIIIIGEDIKREPEYDGPDDEEVITSSLDTDFSDYMSEQKLPGGFAGIDLSDPQQLANFSK